MIETAKCGATCGLKIICQSLYDRISCDRSTITILPFARVCTCFLDTAQVNALHIKIDEFPSLYRTKGNEALFEH